MASFNRVILVGNVTRDIELRYTQSGLAVTDLGLAVNDRRKNQAGEWIDETTFLDVTLWGRQAEVASEYLSKGSPVLIEGRLKLDTWEQEGQKRSKLRVVGERMQMLGGRPSGGSRPEPPQESEVRQTATAQREEAPAQTSRRRYSVLSTQRPATPVGARQRSQLCLPGSRTADRGRPQTVCGKRSSALITVTRRVNSSCPCPRLENDNCSSVLNGSPRDRTVGSSCC